MADKNRPTDQKCGAKTKDGTCGNPAGKMTDHLGFGRCHRHGGASPNGEKNGETLKAAWLERLGNELDPSVKYIADVRDDQSEKTRERLAAAGKLVDTGVKVSGEDAETSVTIVFNMDDLP